jgi:hypothetical protein
MKFGEYYCNERTLDVKLPWGGITIRLWFDAACKDWTDEAQLTLAHDMKRNEKFRNPTPETLDELAKLPGVNAIQVRKELRPGVELGVMAYLVPFENTEVAPVQVVHSAEGAAAIQAMQELKWHGCLTGDCNHTQQAHCDKALADLLREVVK